MKDPCSAAALSAAMVIHYRVFVSRTPSQSRVDHYCHYLYIGEIIETIGVYPKAPSGRKHHQGSSPVECLFGADPLTHQLLRSPSPLKAGVHQSCCNLHNTLH